MSVKRKFMRNLVSPRAYPRCSAGLDLSEMFEPMKHWLMLGVKNWDQVRASTREPRPLQNLELWLNRLGGFHGVISMQNSGPYTP